ncbi:MAG: 30S ribosomal protein S12 methylthiotransferase RimO [Gammaproteobacteria bacterium]
MASITPQIGFVSLGCPKALVDSERILSKLRAEGYGLSASYENADLVVVNTCGFIDSAVKESLDAIGEAMNENGQVIVTGCLGKDSQKIRDAYPDVLAVSGAHAYEEVIGSVHDHLPPPHDPHISLVPPEGIKLTPRHYAYLKISEGCNHRCSFCIIPSMRGDLVSRPIGDVMREAEKLVAAGVKELLVISQDTSAYGVDIKYKEDDWNGKTYRTHIQDLSEALGELGVWVRMHYIYPYPHVDKLIPLMAEEKILPYLDIPMQHGSPKILKAMRRPAAAEKVLDRIKYWRSIRPDITIRSTFIVGFPGETEVEFEELLDFIREARLNRVGCFTYSPVDGAKANELAGHVPEEIKQERLERFMETQQLISEELLEEKIGKVMTVLVDTVDGENTLARSVADAPEIDGLVIIENEQLPVGEFVDVEITDSGEYDLWAKMAGS